MNATTESREHLKSLTVLYVEDEEFSRELGGEFLSHHVGVLIPANNGRKGLDAFLKQKPDIIITDIQMPIMDGLELLKEIRSVDTAIPVVIMSAFEETGYLKQSINLGANGYLNKPIEPAQLTDCLLELARRLLVEKKLRLALAEREDNFRFMQKLTEVIPGMLAYWSTDLRCIFANSGYKEWFGKTPAEMHGIHISELMGEELYQKNEALIRAVLRGEHQVFERELIKADGNIGHTLVHYIPDLVGDVVRGFFVQISDVTELKKSQIKLAQMNA